MASPLSSEDDVFLEKLKANVSPTATSEREKIVEQRIRAETERTQKWLSQMIDDNSETPVSLSGIRIHGVKRTRESFLQRAFDEALTVEKQRSYTLKTALEELQRTTNKLHRFGIFGPTIQIYLDREYSDNERTVLTADLSVAERGRLVLNAGTEFSTTEGGGHINGVARNLFGGAESLYASATTVYGTRSRNDYDLTFATPILANPDAILDASGFVGSQSNQFYASHDELTKGLRARVKFLSGVNDHEISYSKVWRQITNLADNASPTVRNDAKDNVKNSIKYTITQDFRNNKLLPTVGHLLKNSTEIAGFGGLAGDVAFVKNESEIQKAVSWSNGISFTAGLRGGALIPLPFGIGGSTGIRGFKENGLGPRDGDDMVGGDVYLAGGASLFLPLPRLGAESPLRLQTFINGGRLVGLQGIGKKGSNVSRSLSNAVQELRNGYPSIAAGVGLCYAHPAARFELNIAFPLVKRADENARKGLQFGVGIDFL